jgi:hypothetical protein
VFTGAVLGSAFAPVYAYPAPVAPPTYEPPAPAYWYFLPERRSVLLLRAELPGGLDSGPSAVVDGGDTPTGGDMSRKWPWRLQWDGLGNPPGSV